MKRNELGYTLLCAAVIGYVIAIVYWKTENINLTWSSMLKYFGIALSILAINIFAKKLAALRLGCYAEIKPLTWRRYWVTESAYLRREFPAWLVWPFLLLLLSFGKTWWLANTSFETIPLPSRAARKYTHLTELDVGVIAAAGIAANLAAGFVAAILGSSSYAFLNLWFAFFMVLPFPGYDGGKIFFGEPLLYTFMFVFTLLMLILLHITSVLTTVISALLLAIISIFVFYGLCERPRR